MFTVALVPDRSDLNACVSGLDAGGQLRLCLMGETIAYAD
jgi:hypothetical protein